MIQRKALLVLSLTALTACGGIERRRERELLADEGFGTRAQGVATIESYVTGGDSVVFLLDPTLLVQPHYEQLNLLTAPQPVGLDGTIHLPYIGNVPILGLTERELENLVEEQLSTLYTGPRMEVTARIINTGKAIYFFGETNQQGRVGFTRPDLTLFEAIAQTGVTRLANIGRVQLIRPDARNPLVMEVNYREMVLTGNMTYNVLIQENDIIYVPPTFLGQITRFVQKLLTPVTLSSRTLFGIARADFAANRAGYFSF